MSLFLPITKVDVAQRLVYGTISEEVPDKHGEILDYATARPAFEEWSRQFEAASGGKSLGNVRAMHDNIAAGKLTDIHYDDANRRIDGVAKIIDDDEWNKVQEGVYTGFSIGGGYARRWPDLENPGLMRYTPVLVEVSLVDNPAVPTATFQVIKQDGSVELRKFSAELVSASLSKAGDPEMNSGQLLDNLAWLAAHAKKIGANGLLAHIKAIQGYLVEVDEGDIATKKDDFTTGRLIDQSLSPLVDKSSSLLIEELQKRITQLEAQPLPAKGALRAVSKQDDRVFRETTPASLSPADRTMELMKAALANPVML